MCEHIRKDSLFSDVFFFPETNNWQNWEDGTFEPTFDYQYVIDEAIEKYSVIWIQASRGGSKSSRTARGTSKYLLRNGNQACKIVGPSFRQSKESYKYCLKYVRQNSYGENLFYKLEQDIPRDSIREGNDQIFEIANGSTCQALPAGDGETLRGQRATILWLEEFFKADKTLVTSHVKPFLNVKRGDRDNKLIYVTTSWYQDAYAYTVLQEVAKAMKAGSKRHYIVDVTIDDVIRSERLYLADEPEDSTILKHFPADLGQVYEQLQSGTDPVTGVLSDEMLMTFYNKWIKSSANFFRTDKVYDSQSDDVPLLESKPEKFPYPLVMGVDPAAQGADACEMAVYSLPGNNHRHCHAVWKWEKQKPEEIAGHIHKMVDLYGMKDIVLDKTGALGHQIADLCTRKTQLIDGIWQERQPITPHDHPDALFARAHIILTKPSDELMVSGLYGPRVDSTITGEIELKNAMLLDMKARFESGEIKCAARAKDSDYNTVDEKISKGDLLDNIREALAQFPRIDRLKDKDGKPKQDARGNWYFNRPTKDDGAFAMIYANWAANIAYKRIGKPTRADDIPAIWDTEVNQIEDDGWGVSIQQKRLY
jgi:hypothetical protein